MTDPTFDHERLDVFRLSIEYVGFAYGSDLKRIVTMLTRLIQRTESGREKSVEHEHEYEYEYEYEYRDAEYEYDDGWTPDEHNGTSGNRKPSTLNFEP